MSKKKTIKDLVFVPNPLRKRFDALNEAAKDCKFCKGSGERRDGGPCICVPEDQLSRMGREAREARQRNNDFSAYEH